MFDTLQNTVKIEFTLAPDGPVLVRAQTVGIDPGVADMEFQRTERDGKRTVFLAGSGLKGVLRSHCERIVRSSDGFACDPTITRGAEGSCGTRKTEDDPSRPHAGQCAACFTFGSLKVAGRFRVADAFPLEDLWEETNRTEVRTGVGIDRRSQGARRGVLYDTEVVVGGGFRATLTGENFSLWQLALVLQALDDLDAGLVRVGGNKARGMGSMKVLDRTVELGFLRGDPQALAGARPLNGNKYGLPENDAIPTPPGGQPGRRGLLRTHRYEGSAVQDLAELLIAGPLETYLAGRR